MVCHCNGDCQAPKHASGHLSFALVLVCITYEHPVELKSYQGFVAVLSSHPIVCNNGLFYNKSHSLSIVQNVLVLCVKP